MMTATTLPLRRAAPVLLLALAVGLWCSAAQAGKHRGKSVAAFDPEWASAPSVRYADMDGASCLAELGKRQIAFERVAEAPGVVTPVRILDGVGGVVYRTALSRSKRASNPHDVFDCRLVLALDDFSGILRAHGIDEVLMFSGWRPPRPGWPKDEEAKRHPGAMAIDLFRLGRWEEPTSGDATAGKASGGKASDGEASDGKQAEAGARRRVWLDVKKDFGGRIGSTSCGPGARPPSPATDNAKLLRAIVCEAAAARIFTSILTPNYNRPHHNHIHLDLTPKVEWRIVR